ncbi:Arginase/deacetylase [Macrolepiota fuliginosa MF-IS2]|uniref:Arginase/deacetylase n=1 Tax=Macrolepiota fuliginosa MF-IS2 TaxID=1400762 RepID=A0A9P6C4Y9_9AGAR|nr:Arginase/deacetylase [Macrolepiota fuliginosa MF-IS2]
MADTAVFIQDACLQHKYIRSKDKSNVVERPERLRAVNIGISGAIARLESVEPGLNKQEGASGDVGELSEVLGNMRIGTPSGDTGTSVVQIVRSQASVDILNNAAVKFVHGDIEGDVYLENLKKWAKNSWDEIALGRSEIPEGLPQGDLYLCPESTDAIQGALGTVCETVDRIMDQKDPITRAFVAIRPPGHHCGEDSPSGFCFVNNVAVAAAHAHIQHDIKRIVIFDIDLHHGNGMQSIVWSINEETYRQTLEVEAGAPNPGKLGPRIYYGSIHDILSYPCEDGNPALIQAASVSIHKDHGQYVENIHLQTYDSEDHFWGMLYKEQYSRLIQRAEEFIEGTGGPGDDVLVFISCGMDACEHEYPSMSRHNRRVPTSFYHRFTKDARIFVDKYASGRLISVLEGGYSDRALMSASMAHICGLAGSDKVDEEWWNVQNLNELEKATKKRRGGRPSLNSNNNTASSEWLERTVALFNSIDQSTLRTTGHPVPAPPSTRTLRDRSKPSNQSNQSHNEQVATQVGRKAPRRSGGATTRKPRSSIGTVVPGQKPRNSVEPAEISQLGDTSIDSPSLAESSDNEPVTSAQEQERLPKIILKLGKRPEGTGR